MSAFLNTQWCNNVPISTSQCFGSNWSVEQRKKSFCLVCWTYAVADPGFPRGGGANPKGGGANLKFGQFFPKTAWKWRNFGPEGGRASLAPPLDPPLLWHEHGWYDTGKLCTNKIDCTIDHMQLVLLIPPPPKKTTTNKQTKTKKHKQNQTNKKKQGRKIFHSTDPQWQNSYHTQCTTYWTTGDHIIWRMNITDTMFNRQKTMWLDNFEFRRT